MLELGCVHIELGAGRRRLHETVLHFRFVKVYSIFTFTLFL